MGPFFEKIEEHQHWLKYYQKAIDVNIITSITDHNGVIIYVNDKFCEVSGYSRKELVGQTHKIINSSYHSKDFFKRLWDTIHSGELWSGEIRNRSKRGNYYWVDTVVIPVHMNNKVQYLSLRTVITEKKEFEDKNQEYIKSLEALLFMVSHEVRAPLVSILGLMQLDYSNISKKDLNKILVYIKRSAEDLDVFVKKMNLQLMNIKNSVEKSPDKGHKTL